MEVEVTDVPDSGYLRIWAVVMVKIGGHEVWETLAYGSGCGRGIVVRSKKLRLRITTGVHWSTFCQGASPLGTNNQTTVRGKAPAVFSSESEEFNGRTENGEPLIYRFFSSLPVLKVVEWYFES
jgi:hypothetical protein